MRIRGTGQRIGVLFPSWGLGTLPERSMCSSLNRSSRLQPAMARKAHSESEKMGCRGVENRCCGFLI